ncbi:MAG: sigma-70 family RNA polymerase sigma factor [Bacteroidia bacterium]|nr:sigma-70 family RNA polymerase sigma factor [Bacteroidia bacterium]NNC84727.1 sigma-70 family RNA polymerase sigma factor [Bacteroidia bacterium]NNM16636.1 sigma-70 family RNA polymerase sigma factor [Bacteroidia bacterium]
MSTVNNIDLEKAFIDLLENNKRLIFKIASAYEYNPEFRKDLIQDIIIQLWKAFPNFDNKHAVSTWIYRIALNVSISWLRKEKSRKKTHTSYAQDFIIETETENQNEKMKLLYKFLNELKELDKAIMILRLEGLNNEEISNIMGISTSNVSTKVNRIKNTLSEKFKKINT